MCVRVYIYICECTCVYVYLHVRVCVRVYVCICVYRDWDKEYGRWSRGRGEARERKTDEGIESRMDERLFMRTPKNT